MRTVTVSAQARFRAAYAAHRAAEGRRYSEDQLLALPFLAAGGLARQWQVRARTFTAFRRRVLDPLAASSPKPLHVLDLGAGNGWLSYRVALDGHTATAVDWRGDDVDGLGAAGPFVARVGSKLRPVVASFEALPLRAAQYDVVVFNASLHYALDLAGALGEAVRVCRRHGTIAVLDSPWYADESEGLAMVEEKRREASERFGRHAGDLVALPFVEFITHERLAAASKRLRMEWRRHRVRYPLWYEWRPVAARLRGARAPSRFDFWTAVTP